jgi:UDP-glucuronate 4-epimerase
MDFVHAIENTLDRKAIIERMPMQAGDVVKTWANVKDLSRNFIYKPDTSIKDGIETFIAWYNEYYKFKN